MRAGLTLIELVAAMAVFALIAVMGLQALTGSLRMRDALGNRADRTADLGRTLALLRHDLAAALPMTFYPPGDTRPISAIEDRAGGFEMSRGGLHTDGGAPRIGRVEWVLSGDTLARHVWPTITPASPAQRSPAMTAMRGITALTIRSYWPPGTWAPGLRPPGLGTARPTGPESGDQDGDSGNRILDLYSSTLPLAVEITLQTRDFGDIVLIESLK